MLRRRKSFLLLFFLLTALPFASFAAAPQTVVLDVPGMTCQFCPITIRKALEKVDGVIEAKVVFEGKTATVTFDPDKTNVEALIRATTDAGYPSTVKK
ncbi:MAG TPA: mercury resistance system periplasmic binding protein MerP [Gammaproteobacteria bacterium]|nr:mercury resistance system periplasmic binding protein MerP [Gammaproteobacteria bacterium]